MYAKLNVFELVAKQISANKYIFLSNCVQRPSFLLMLCIIAPKLIRCSIHNPSFLDVAELQAAPHSFMASSS